MKLKPFARLAFLLGLLAGFSSFGRDTNDVSVELRNLFYKVQGKLNQGQKTEAELAAEIQEFDSLVAKHKEEKSDAVAQVLIMKTKLYLQVFDDPDKGIAVLEQLKRDFPETTPGKNADEIIESVKQQLEERKRIEEAKKIQLALQEGVKFPDFEERDIANQPLSTTKYRGKVLLVDFWATWCMPCMLELPNVLQTYGKYHSKGLEIIGISLDEDKAKVTSFLKAKNIPWQQFCDGKRWTNKLAAKYGILGIPSTYLLDGEGKIIGRNLRGPELEDAVSKALTTN